MRPTQQFVNMIGVLYQSRQKAITQSDYNKHHNGPVTFYIMSEIVMQNGRIVSQSEPFSNQKLIEVGKNVEEMIIGTDQSYQEYKRKDFMKFESMQGQGLLHWKVQNNRGENFTAVKLMSPDGCVQLKIISDDQTTQWVYNVCELPNN